MSLLTQTRLRAPRLSGAVSQQVAQQRARLSVVTGTGRTVSRLPFAAVVLTLLAAGLVGLLILNTSLQQGAVRAGRLQDRAAELALQQQALELRVDALREPQRVAVAARRLGMVPVQNPAFLHLDGGRILGRPTPAVAGTGLRIVAPMPRIAPPPIAAVTSGRRTTPDRRDGQNRRTSEPGAARGRGQ